jgi:predicted HAD superfamily Cof-like phosphohydrolase
MKKELQMVREFHEKFNVVVGKELTLIDEENSKNRYEFMKEEVDEYFEGTQKEDLPNIAKELCDILYVTYGTILAHGLQDKMEELFEEVHKSNMSKEYHPVKAIKGSDYKKADTEKFLKGSD